MDSYEDVEQVPTEEWRREVKIDEAEYMRLLAKAGEQLDRQKVSYVGSSESVSQ